MKVRHPQGLVGEHNGALAKLVLCGHARGAAIGVALLRLQAAHGEHEAARGVAPIGAERHHSRHVET
jgi:hypothetical protein